MRKGICLPYIYPDLSPKKEELMENDDEVPVTDECSQVELDKALNEMIARAGKCFDPQEVKRLRALVYRFKDI
jgi:hypothetical protein